MGVVALKGLAVGRGGVGVYCRLVEQLYKLLIYLYELCRGPRRLSQSRRVEHEAAQQQKHHDSDGYGGGNDNC